jgi:hypothetical protein
MNKGPVFKIGDKVRRLLNPLNFNLDKTWTVAEISTGGYIRFRGEDKWHNPADFIPVIKETIVITTDGNDGGAKYIKNGEVIKSVKLVRDKNDKHDMKALAAYAVQKLIPDDGNILINVKAGYTGSVCVVNSTNPNYKNGKIFEFIGGECINSHYPFAGHKFNDLSAINKFCKGYHINFNVLELHRQ